jgi:hypothetical protein
MQRQVAHHISLPAEVPVREKPSSKPQEVDCRADATFQQMPRASSEPCCRMLLQTVYGREVLRLRLRRVITGPATVVFEGNIAATVASAVGMSLH